MLTEADAARADDAPYVPRRIVFLDVRDVCGWKIKVYAIVAAGSRIDDDAVETALRRAGDALPVRGAVENGFANRGVAFLIAHFGADGCWYLLDWWVHDCMLKQRMFAAPLADPTAMQEITGQNYLACVYELGVIDRERRFWIEHVMGDGDMAAYLAAHADGAV